MKKKITISHSDKSTLVRLGDVCIYSKGKKPKVFSEKKKGETIIPYIDIKAFEKNIITQFTDGQKCNLCSNGDLLMVWDGARAGYVGRAPMGAVGSTLMKIEPRELINKDYLYFFLQSLFTKINTNPRGVGIPHVEPSILWNEKLNLPSLDEQEQIVSKIEELFSELDKGIENLKTAQSQLKVYRQAVLKWAFEGRLTNDNVKDGELPKGWKWVKNCDISTSITDGDHMPPPKSKHGIPFITISNIHENKIDFTRTFFVPESYYSALKESRKPKTDDILYSVTGSFGIPVLVDFNKKFCFQRHIGLIRPKADIIPKWFYYLLQSPQIFNQAKQSATGTAQKTVSLKSLRNFSIPYCTQAEQQIIAQEIESRLNVCDKIEETIINGLKQAEVLRQSILKNAFEGKLVNKQIKKQYKPKNVYFFQAQVLSLINKYSNEKSITHGEMTIAKNAYFLDKLFDVPTYFNFQRWHLGPYPPEMKKIIKNKKYFRFNKNIIELASENTLLKYANPYQETIQFAIEELSGIFLKYSSKERAYKAELLATVCKVIEDIQSTDLLPIRQSMKEWPIDLPRVPFKNKAEKFSEEETLSCINFIKSKDWDKKLIK